MNQANNLVLVKSYKKVTQNLVNASTEDMHLY